MQRTALTIFFLTAFALPAAEPTPTGPAAEKRFPPLKLPPGFKATLFACDPFIEYPSVIANGPRTGSLYVGVDYMTGLGTDGVVKSEVRLLEDTDGDGYADKSTVYAKGFNSIEGIAYHDGTVYVMHAPFLTALRDTKGTSVADERKDLLEGLGLTPEKNPVRLHCANGVVVGHDGWLYLAMGDNGTNVKRPEGDRLVLNGGGILRCRRDGTDLHIFAIGTRNIYDISLDEDLNVFFRDNENDGGTYMIRVCHSFFGADHGYPYKYYERPDEALRPIGDFGLGSSAGGVCYLEKQFPPEYRGNLFNCEWGKSVVRSVPKREGSGFAQLNEIEFAAGADNDPYGFKPTDLVVDRDGALFVSDWADGQRPKRGRGRIYRITYVDAKPESNPVKNGLLDSESYHQRLEAQAVIERQGRQGLAQLQMGLKSGKVGVRARLHAIWILTHLQGPKAIDDLRLILEKDADARVQAQAVRAIADLADPVLVKHKLDAGVGDAVLASQLAKLSESKDSSVVREIVIALTRMRWAAAPEWLAKTMKKPDVALAHSAMMLLRRCSNWPEVMTLLDLPSDDPIRVIALRAVAEQSSAEVVDGLLERLRKEKSSQRRLEYADLLTRVFKRPSAWVYWGYRPPPRPANTVAWDRTNAIEAALDVLLREEGPEIRLKVLQRMQREKVTTRLFTLVKWLREEMNPDAALAIFESLREHPALQTRLVLEPFITGKSIAVQVRQAALKQFVADLDDKSENRLLALASKLEDGPILAEALRQIGKRPKLRSTSLLLLKVESGEAETRAAALEAFAELNTTEAAAPILKLLTDPDARVRRAAASAAGKLKMKESTHTLLKLARDPDATVRRAGLMALHQFVVPEALKIAVEALADPETQQAALAIVTRDGGGDQISPLVELAKRNPSSEVLPRVIRTLSEWEHHREVAVHREEIERRVAELQGDSGILVYWHGAEAMTTTDAAIARFTTERKHDQTFAGNPFFGTGLEARIQWKLKPKADGALVAWCDFASTDNTDVQFLAGGSAGLRVWLNGKPIFQRVETQPYRVDGERFDATLEKGSNRVLIHFPTPKGDVDFHLRFRRKSSTALHEKFTQAALTRNGNVENGRKLFFNLEKTQCAKCHRVGDQGEKIGPELTGLGSRFSRIHLIESILEPSRTIASSFQTWAVTLNDGKTITGVKIAETEKTVTFADKDGKKHELSKSAIEAQRLEKLSVMPEGLEKPLTVDEFVDLIGFLASQKETRPR